MDFTLYVCYNSIYNVPPDLGGKQVTENWLCILDWVRISAGTISQQCRGQFWSSLLPLARQKEQFSYVIFQFGFHRAHWPHLKISKIYNFGRIYV